MESRSSSVERRASTGDAPVVEPLIGGKYQLIRAIGKGGFSWVYLAQHMQIKSLRVAVKILKERYATNASTVARFQREAEAAALLKNRHTVNVMDLGMTESGYPYLVMEFVRGITLARFLKERNQMRVTDVARIARDILEALEEAHEQNLIHRDLKPGNIFLVQDRKTRNPIGRVIDFGIAKFFAANLAAGVGEDDALTVEGSVACTPKYASPELLRGHPTPQADVYALGLIMAEMLQGQAPYADENTFVSAAAHLRPEPVPLEPITEDSILGPIIRKAIEKDPKKRYTSVTDMMDDIERVLEILQPTIKKEEPLDITPLVAKFSPRFDPTKDGPSSIISSVSSRSGRIARVPLNTGSYEAAHLPDSKIFEPVLAHDEELLSRPATGTLTPRSQSQFIQAAPPKNNNGLWMVAAVALALVGTFGLFKAGVFGGAEANTIEPVPEVEEPPLEIIEDDDGVVVISGAIREDSTWTSDNDYELEGVVYVEGGTLTIEPGVTVRGRRGSALVVARNGNIHAQGTESDPIVFTSAQPVGSRHAGDWGGLVLMGSAPVNRDDARIEGLAETDIRGHYGGDNPLDSCGVLSHVRIEFAGYEAYANNELNGLTLGGCGSRSVIRNVQVHRTLDDGIEVFGGTVNLQNILITSAGDDGLDWDQGWVGNAQFVLVQNATHGADNGIEADNSGDDHDAEPRSAPVLYNVTLLGTGSDDAAGRGIVLRRGSAGTFRNIVIAGFPTEAVDIRDETTAELIDDEELTFDGVFIYNSGPFGNQPFPAEEGDADDDDGFDELTYFTSRELTSVRINEDPLLSNASYDATEPNLVPPLASALARDAVAIPQDDFWDQSARYIGAVRPGEEDTWFSGWSAFPEN